MEYDIDNHFLKLINDSSKNSKTILELGGVSRPVLKKKESYRYVGIDIDDEFIHDKFYDGFYCQSVEDQLPEKGDLIFSGTPKGVSKIIKGDKLIGYIENEKFIDLNIITFHILIISIEK